MMYDDEIIDEILQKVKVFDSVDLNDPIMVIGVNAVAMKALVEVQSSYAGFDGDVFFDYDPDPYLKVSWWHSMTGSGDEIIFRFHPLRVEGDISDLVVAYERAMSVI